MQKTRLTSLIKRILIILFVCCTNTSCDKNDELSLQGNLNLSFYNYTPDLKVRIYSLENKETPIYEVSPKEDGTLDMPLNVGNYLAKPYSARYYYRTIGFQIMQRKTTHITYDKNNQETVTLN